MASPSRPLPASSPHRQQHPPSPTAPASSPHPPLVDLQLYLHAPDPAPLPQPSSSLPSPLPCELEPRQNPLRCVIPAHPRPQDEGGNMCFSAGRSLSSGRAAAASAAAAAAAAQPAPFLTKTYDLVDDEDTDAVISWNARGDGFVVWDTRALCLGLLPRYFRHANFASFIRQLNTYGFSKSNHERWEFAKPEFLRGHRHLLGCIHRKASANAGAPHHRSHHRQPEYIVGSSSSSMLVSASDASLEAPKCAIREELNLLKAQVCRLRQRLHKAEGRCQGLWQRLQMSKSYEKHMTRFVVRARHDPSFLTRLAEQYATGSLEMPKRQPLRIHMMDARRENQQASSAQSMESRHSLSVNQSQTPQQSEENTGNTASTEVAECSSREDNGHALRKYL